MILIKMAEIVITKYGIVMSGGNGSWNFPNLKRMCLELLVPASYIEIL